MCDTVIIIPALNPDEQFSRLVRELFEVGFSRVVVVNDGSRPDCTPRFAQAEALGAVVLVHPVNLGKGRALKTAFVYVLETWGEGALAVCADADGQHRLPDIRAVAARLAERPDSLVMGCRSFSDPAVPFRSRFGNKLTRFVFRLLCGVRVSDTQTGLRGLSGATMRKFLPSGGDRFEYEMNMLLDARAQGVPLAEVPIRTVYLAKNETSHFHPLRDSLRIYSVFLKFVLSSLAAFVIDFLLFCLFSFLFGGLAQSLSIFLSTLLARAASSFTNYCVNKKKVFRVEEGRGRTMLRYYILCVAQLICSAGLVSLVTGITGVDERVWKIPVDLVLFVISFQIQREWVFRKPEKQERR